MAKIIPFAPIRNVRVFANFGVWTVLLERKGQKSRHLGNYSDIETAERAAARVRRIERVPKHWGAHNEPLNTIAARMTVAG